MKAKVYFFRLIIGLSTFGLGIGVYFVWQSFPAQTVEAIPNMVKPVAVASPIFMSLQPVTDSKADEAVENIEEKEDEFYAGGDYYLIGNSPKGFEDFESLSISTDDWDDKLEKLAPTAPKGSLFTKKEHKFTRIAINNRWLSFKTEKINGISYEFIGNYPKEEISLNNGEDFVYLQGRLIKFKDGKKVAEIEVKFGAIDGC